MKSPGLIRNLFMFLILQIIAFSLSTAAVKEYYVTCKQSDFNNIYENYEEEKYIPGKLEYDGKDWDIRLRIRGDGSRSLPKKSLKVQFDSDDFVTGADEINLNSEYADPGYAQHYLSARLFRETGNPCFDAEHVKLFVNGNYLGLYLQVQNIDKDFLRSIGFDVNGNLYKAAKDWSALSAFDDIDVHWEKKTNEDEPMDDLQRLIYEINHIENEDFDEYIKRTFNYDELINVFALNMLLSHGSTYYHNYYLFNDKNVSGKWYIFPWDMDKTFASYGPQWPFHMSSGTNAPDSPLLELCLINDQIFSDIKNRIDEIRENYFNNEFLTPILDSLENELADAVAADTMDNTEITGFHERYDQLNGFIDYRYNFLKDRISNTPRQFRLERPAEYSKSDVHLTWTRSESPLGNEISYDLYYSTNPLYPLDDRNLIEDIKDTSYVIRGLDEGEDYFFLVRAKDDKYNIDSYDNFNYARIRKGADLPAELASDMILDKAGSPYYLNGDLNIKSGATLTLNPGATLMIADSAYIHCAGSLKLLGSEKEKARLLPQDGAQSWGAIFFQIGSRGNLFKNAFIKNGRIIGLDCQLTMDSVEFENTSQMNNTDAMLFIDWSEVVIRNSLFKGNNTGEGLIYYQCRNSLIENCRLYYMRDAIEVIRVTNTHVRNNEIYHAHDDAIDMNEGNAVQVENNIIYDIRDKGISIGNDHTGISKDVEVRGNLLVKCGKAVAVKSGSNAFIENNTIYDCSSGINVYEKYEGGGGATAEVKNCIFSQIRDSVIYADGKSSINISYSLCDTETLPGIGNLKDDPHFLNPEILNFKLADDSPCIDAGDPSSGNDPDGTRADMGAFYHPQAEVRIVINEINYHSNDDFDSEDWFEIYNDGEEPVDLSGWTVKDDNDEHEYIIPAGTGIDPGAYLVICQNLETFRAIHHDVENVIGEFDFGFSASGDMVRIFDSGGITVDSVNYDDKDPWPEAADGDGPSLELIHPKLDNALPESWRPSEGLGTPGRRNSTFTGVEDAGAEKLTFNIYPNPAERETSFDFYLQESSDVNIRIVSSEGRIMNEYSLGYMTQGRNNAKLDCSGLSSGMYFIILEAGKYTAAKSLLILK